MSDVTTEWEQSAELGELAKALAAAQGEMENAAKSKDNPFFKSKYADLAAIKGVSQASLTKHVLAVTGQNFTRGSEAGVIGERDEECIPEPRCHACLEVLAEGNGVDVPGEGEMCRECAHEWASEEARIAGEGA